MRTNSSDLLLQAQAGAGGTNDIRAIKPPVEIPSGYAWLWWTLGLLLAAALLFVLWRFWRKRLARPALAPAIPPHVRARQRLQEALALLSEPRPFCILISDTLRLYLEERFALRAPERTTEEFLQDLQGTAHLTRDQKDVLADFLSRCDLVKFARDEPNEAALRDLHDAALRLVDETQYEPVGQEIGSRLPPAMGTVTSARRPLAAGAPSAERRPEMEESH